MCVMKVTEDAVPVGARGAITAGLIPFTPASSVAGEQPGSWPLEDGHPAACSRHPPGGPGRSVPPRLQRKLAGKHIFYCFSCPSLSSLRLPRASWSYFSNKLMALERSHNKTKTQTGSGVCWARCLRAAAVGLIVCLLCVRTCGQEVTGPLPQKPGPPGPHTHSLSLPRGADSRL